jgi:hypothetical protein
MSGITLLVISRALALRVKRNRFCRSASASGAFVGGAEDAEAPVGDSEPDSEESLLWKNRLRGGIFAELFSAFIPSCWEVKQWI